MKNKNNNQNEFERLGGQKSGGGGYIPSIPGSATAYHCSRLKNLSINGTFT